MKRLHKIIAGVAGTVALVAVTAVVAAPAAMGGCEGMGHMGMMRSGMHGGNMDMAAMAERHLSDLKTQLKITAQQEPAWQAFATKVGDNAKAMQASRAAAPAAADAKVTAPDRMAQHITQMQQHLASMQTMQGALKDLYAVLTPEQKAIADQHAQRMGGHGHEDHEGHGMGPRG